MRVNNLCHLPSGWKVTSRAHSQREMTFVVRAKYDLRPDKPLLLAAAELDVVPELEERIAPVRITLGQGSLSAERYADDDESRSLGPSYPGDFADFKPSAEILVRASCHPPPGRTVNQCSVSVELSSPGKPNAWSKQLRVYGPRAWVDSVIGGKSTEPLALAATPIDYRHAYGGPDHPMNPSGMGHASEQLPRIEPEDGHDYNREQIAPAGFGPLNPQWPQRALLQGKRYGADWRRERAPFYASDFDWRFFQAAPSDQQLNGYLRGDETLRLTNLHPDAARLSLQLPATRVRTFVFTEKEEIRELTMNLDTLFVDVEEGAVYLTWRGLTEVQREDLTDIQFALVATEPLDDSQPRAGYEDQLRAFADDPIGLKERFPDGIDPRADPLAAMQPPAADDKEPVSTMLQQLSGKGMPGAGGEDTSGALSNALQRIAKLDEPVQRALQKSLEQAVQQAKSGFAAGGVADGRLQLPLRRLLRPMAKHFATLKASGANSPGLDQLEKALADPLIAQVDPSQPTDPADDEQPPAGPGVDWSGRDLSEQDLSGLDLSGANLETCNLSKANLRGTNLTGANLRMTVLERAVLDGAILVEADLTHASMGFASANETDFSRCVLEMARFRSVKMPAARFDGATGLMVSFSYCEMAGVSWKGVSFEQLCIEDCDFDDADLSGATLIRGLIRNSRAPRIALTEATLSGTGFIDCRLAAANVERATGTNVIFLKSNLDDANFDLANLPEAKLMEVSAVRARFDAADLRFARFDKAVLRQALMSRCNLRSADLRNTVLSKVSFRDANLYDAKLVGAAGAGIDWTGANLGRLNAERSEVVLP